MSAAKGYPHKQDFNITNKAPNKTKRKAWWQVGTSCKTEQPKKKES